MFVDTHAHLCDKVFDPDRDRLVAAALAGGMPFLVNVGYDAETCERAFALAERVPEVWATAGVHPHEAGKYGPAGARALVARWADHPKMVAVGEMGLDYHYDHSPRDVQRETFRAQLDEARARDLPFVMHVRESEADALELVAAAGWPRGVWHCFTADRAAAARAVEGGLYVSFSGILTFKAADELRAVARELPLDRILTETDCPFLAPVPHRGRRNEPAYVNLVGAAIARERGMSEADLARQVEANARRLFGLPAGGKP